MPRLKTPRLVTGTRIAVASEHGLLVRIAVASQLCLFVCLFVYVDGKVKQID